MAKRTCSIESCDGAHFGRGFCQKHLYRLRENGDPLIVRSNGGPIGEASKHWRGDAVAYAAVHRRLRAYRGPAKNFTCINCGAAGQEWAYQHGAANELACDKTGIPYSTNLDDYEPMCRLCHRRLDALHGWLTPVKYARGASLVAKTGRWRAYVSTHGKQVSAGTHGTNEEALAAAEALRLRLIADM